MSDTESGVDHLDRLPDSLLLLFNRISDVKSLARCSLVSRRFRSLVHSLLRVDCVLSDDSTTTAAASSSSSSHPIYNYNKAAKSLLSLLLRFFSRPFHSLSLNSTPPPAAASCSASSPDVSHTTRPLIDQVMYPHIVPMNDFTCKKPVYLTRCPDILPCTVIV